MVIGYARVSTDEQTNAAQLSELKKAGCKRIYEEKLSGRDADRPELKRCLDRLDEGDTLMVWRLDRLGRSLRDLLEIVNSLQKRKVTFVSLKERFDTGTAAGRLIFHFFASLTQFERELIRERTVAGLTAARARGRLGGRRRKLDDKQAEAIRTLWDSNRHAKHDIAERFGVSKSTIDRIVRPVPIKTSNREGIIPVSKKMVPRSKAGK
jgi:DNA invertase Pin-like site-specific DNA recombinase